MRGGKIPPPFPCAVDVAGQGDPPRVRGRDDGHGGVGERQAGGGEGSFYTVREIWCPVQVRCEKLPMLEVENRFDFTRLDECRFEWELVRFPEPGSREAGKTVIAKGALAGPRVAPHASGQLELPLPTGWKDADAVFVTVRDPVGRELWTWSWPIQSRDAQLVRAMSQNGAAGAVAIDDAEDRLTVRVGDGLSLAFDKRIGYIAGVTVRGEPVPFSNGPRLVASATQTVRQEQGEGKKPKTVSSMRDLAGTNTFTRLTHRMEGSDAVIDVEYEGALRSVRWIVRPDGWVRLEYAYRIDQPCDLAGIQFDYPEKLVKSIRRLGQGPYRVWKNRLKGTRWDVWQNAYNDTVPGESWGFPEFKGYFGNWFWATFETEEGWITFMSSSGDTYLGVYRPNEGPDPARTKIYTPPTGLAVFDAIPPIGTKFTDPHQSGPQSQPNPAQIENRNVIFLRFD